MESSKIIKFLKDNPGAIASEIGATSIEMNRAFKAGLVIKLGTRKMNRRGAPPIEWAVPGTEGAVQDSRVSDHLAAARKRIEDHEAYERSYAALSATRMTFGIGSPEHLEYKAQHMGDFPVPVPLPNVADYALMGAAFEVPEGVTA